nr:hypothetical protein [Ktedonobacteraceae bacterium]
MHISSRFKLTIIFSLLLVFVVGLTLRSFGSTPTHAAKVTHGWRIVASPLVNGGVLRAVAAVSATNVWAVGTTNSSTLIEHYSGKQWSVVANPNAGAWELNAVKAISTTNIWAVGNSTSNGSALIEHYNGTQWGSVISPLPSDGYSTYTLTGMTVLSASNIWASGYSSTNEGDQTLIEHYNGIQWSVIPTFTYNYNTFSMFNAINAASANDVWAVGSSWDATDDSGNQSTLIEHWDGFQWSVISSPSPGNDDWLNAVIAVSSTDVKAVGAVSTNSYALAEHWDGTQWTYASPPNGGFTANYLNGEIVFATNNAWAVGGYSNANPYTVKPLIEHWDGVHWTIIANPGTSSSYSELLGISKVPNTTTLWAVGDLYNNGYQPLIEFYS